MAISELKVSIITEMKKKHVGSYCLVSSAAWTEEFNETSSIWIEEEKSKNCEGKWSDQEECQVEREHFGGEMHWKIPVESQKMSNIRSDCQSGPNDIRSCESMDEDCEQNEEEETKFAVSHMFIGRCLRNFILSTAEQEEGRKGLGEYDERDDTSSDSENKKN